MTFFKNRHNHFFFMSILLLRTYYGSKILQFDTRNSILRKIYIIFYCQQAKFPNAAHEKVHLDLLKSLLKIKLNAHSQLSKKFVDKLYSPSFFAVNHLNYSEQPQNGQQHVLFSYEEINRKKSLILLISFFGSSPILSGLLSPRTS